MDAETIKAVGAIVGLAGGLVTLIERLVTLRRKRSRKSRGRKYANLSLPVRRLTPSGLLLKDEVLIVIAAALLINFVALSLSTRLTSILYLDMTGTAIAALLLGPWYGAIAGLLSNALVNWILYPGVDGDLVVFPWAIVNVSGGLLWGYFGRTATFARFMLAPNAGMSRHVVFLLKFGVLGAMLMAIPGTVVQAALGQKLVLALDPEVATALDRFFAGSLTSVKAMLLPVFGDSTSDTIARYALGWIQNTARYIPDKTLSFAIAVVAIKSAFPLFERALIHPRTGASAVQPNRLEPTLLLALLGPYTIVLLLSSRFGAPTFWPLWISPLVIAMLGILFESANRSTHLGAGNGKEQRRKWYSQARQLLPRDAAARPGPSFAVACLAASLLFVLVLPLLVTNYLRVAFNFLALVYGFQLALHLYCIAVSQNLAIRNIGDTHGRREQSKAG
jgi:Co/Zn/Cd efflux system component